MYKIAISAGHGRNTAGKRCMKKLDPNQTREWVLNARIAEKVEKLLQDYAGWELLRLDDRNGNTDVALKNRSRAANSWAADIYIAIHHNAGIRGGKGGGIVAYVYTKPSAESLAWQKALYDALIAKTGLKGNRSKPLAKANLHEVRAPKMPAVLLELGFMDSQTDVPVILSEAYADKCAEAIVETTAQRGKLVKKGTVEPERNTVTNRLDFAESFSEEKKGTYRVASRDGCLNLRAGAGADKPLIEVMENGSTVKCYGYHTGAWLYVVAQSGKIGFCHAGYLKRE